MISPSGDTATPEGLAEEAKAERDYKGRALISFVRYVHLINIQMICGVNGYLK